MEWALVQSVFQAVVAHFGLSPVIDLLVTPLNSQLPVFSLFLDPAVFSVDALSVLWDLFEMAYAFSSMVFVHNMLMKLGTRTDSATRGLS